MSQQLVQTQRVYERTVRQFVEQRGGVFLVLTEDSVFVNTLRSAIYKHLVLKGGSVRTFTQRDPLLKELREAIKKNQKVLLIVEREIGGSPNHEFIKFVRANIPDISILVMTMEIARESLILLLEVGATSCFTKPISVNSLIEKIAHTIKPPSKLVELVNRGKKLLLQKEYEKALRIANKILEFKPDSPAALMLKGDALKNLNKRKEALAAYRSASEFAEMYLEPLKKLADYYHEEGDQEKELNYLDQLDELSPLNVERKMSIGTINVNLGNLVRAEEMFDQVIKLTNKDARNRVSSVSKNIGDFLLSKNAAGLAEKYLTHSLYVKRRMISKSDMETFNTLGITLRKQGKWQEAIKNYRNALKIAPNQPNLHYNLALAYQDGNDFGPAAEALEAALKIKSDLGFSNDTVSFNIGFIFDKAERSDVAVKYLTLAVKKNTTNNAKSLKLLKELMARKAARPAEGEGSDEEAAN